MSYVSTDPSSPEGQSLQHEKLQKVVIRQGSVYCLRFTTPETLSVLVWQFDVLGQNVLFEVLLNDTTVLHKKKKFNHLNEGVYEGRYELRGKLGGLQDTVSLVWDNSFSLMTPKVILFRAKLIEKTAFDSAIESSRFIQAEKLLKSNDNDDDDDGEVIEVPAKRNGDGNQAVISTRRRSKVSPLSDTRVDEISLVLTKIGVSAGIARLVQVFGSIVRDITSRFMQDNGRTIMISDGLARDVVIGIEALLRHGFKFEGGSGTVCDVKWRMSESGRSSDVGGPKRPSMSSALEASIFGQAHTSTNALDSLWPMFIEVGSWIESRLNSNKSSKRLLLSSKETESIWNRNTFDVDDPNKILLVLMEKCNRLKFPLEHVLLGWGRVRWFVLECLNRNVIGEFFGCLVNAKGGDVLRRFYKGPDDGADVAGLMRNDKVMSAMQIRVAALNGVRFRLLHWSGLEEFHVSIGSVQTMTWLGTNEVGQPRQIQIPDVLRGFGSECPFANLMKSDIDREETVSSGSSFDLRREIPLDDSVIVWQFRCNPVACEFQVLFTESDTMAGFKSAEPVNVVPRSGYAGSPPNSDKYFYGFFAVKNRGEATLRWHNPFPRRRARKLTYKVVVVPESLFRSATDEGLSSASDASWRHLSDVCESDAAIVQVLTRPTGDCPSPFPVTAAYLQAVPLASTSQAQISGFSSILSLGGMLLNNVVGTGKSAAAVVGIDSNSASSSSSASSTYNLQSLRNRERWNEVRSRLLQEGGGLFAVASGRDAMTMQMLQDDDILKRLIHNSKSPYQLMEEDNRYQKYFKMLGMGVLRDAVGRQMKVEGISQELIDVFVTCGDLEKLTKMTADSSKSATVKKATKVAVKPLTSLRSVYWEEITDKSAKRSLYKPIRSKTAQQSKIMDSRIIFCSDEMERFEHLFAHVAGGFAEKDTKTKQIAEAGSPAVLEGKRCNNISILLAQFKKTHSQYSDILRSVLNLNDRLLTARGVEALMEMIPTEAEQRKLVAYKNKQAELCNAERFMLAMCDVPRVGEKINSLLFKTKALEDTVHLKEQLDLMMEACEQVLHCRGLSRVLNYFLTLGNIMNSRSVQSEQGGAGNDGNAKSGSALGFSLESLIRVAETRATISGDRAWKLTNSSNSMTSANEGRLRKQDKPPKYFTLIDYVVLICSENRDSISLNFPNDLSCISQAKRLPDPQQMKSTVNLIRRALVHTAQEVREEGLYVDEIQRQIREEEERKEQEKIEKQRRVQLEKEEREKKRKLNAELREAAEKIWEEARRMSEEALFMELEDYLPNIDIDAVLLKERVGVLWQVNRASTGDEWMNKDLEQSSEARPLKSIPVLYRSFLFEEEEVVDNATKAINMPVASSQGLSKTVSTGFLAKWVDGREIWLSLDSDDISKTQKSMLSLDTPFAESSSSRLESKGNADEMDLRLAMFSDGFEREAALCATDADILTRRIRRLRRIMDKRMKRTRTSSFSVENNVSPPKPKLGAPPVAQSFEMESSKVALFEIVLLRCEAWLRAVDSVSDGCVGRLFRCNSIDIQTPPMIGVGKQTNGLAAMSEAKTQKPPAAAVETPSSKTAKSTLPATDKASSSGKPAFLAELAAVKEKKASEKKQDGASDPYFADRSVFVKGMREFLAAISQQVDSLTAQSEKCDRLHRQLYDYIGEGEDGTVDLSAATPLSQIFGILEEFAVMFTRSKKVLTMLGNRQTRTESSLESKDDVRRLQTELGDLVLTSCHIFGTIHGFQPKSGRAIVVSMGNWSLISCSTTSLFKMPKFNRPIEYPVINPTVSGVTLITRFGRGQIIGIQDDADKTLIVKLSFGISFVPLDGRHYSSNQFQVSYS